MWGVGSLWFWFAFPRWLVMWHIFPCICWPSVCLFWKSVYSGPLPIKKHRVICSFAIELYEFFIYLGVLPLYQICVCSIAELCLTLCNTMNCRLPGSSVHGISQARMLEWFAISSSRGSSWSRDGAHISYVSCTGRWILYHWATWEALIRCMVCKYFLP